MRKRSGAMLYLFRNISPIRLCAVCLIAFSFSCAPGRGVERSAKQPPVPKAGVLDLRHWDFEKDGPIVLDGEWAFEWGRLVPPAEVLKGGKTAPVPGFFSDRAIGKTNFGHATYRLRILTNGESRTLALHTSNIYSSARVFVDGRDVAAAGKAGTSRETSAMFFVSRAAEVRMRGTETDLLLHVSNYHHRNGGLRGPLQLGTFTQIARAREMRLARSLFLCGSLLLMGLYQLAIFFLLRRGRAAVYFGIACLLLALRTLVVDDIFIVQLLPVGANIIHRLEYLTVLAPLFVLIAFIGNLFPDEFSLAVTRILAAIYAVLCLIVIIAPPHIYTYVLYAHWPTSSALTIYVIIAVVVAVFRRREGALLMLAGIFALSAAGINDNLHYAGVIHTSETFSLGMLGLIFSQGVILALRYANSLFRSEKLAADLAENNRELRETNTAVSRFVPRDFLRHLGRDRILDVKLGDQTERKMTVLFSDIRDFTTLSETMSPQDNFNFINSYLKRMEPLITGNAGFIDKYIGDAIMALFSGEGKESGAGADSALRSALAMLAALVPYNAGRERRGFAPVRIGIGLNTGRLMLGTVGGANRMDGTVISDAVNLASRIESMSKIYGATLLISEYARESLMDAAAYMMRPADRVLVKGKSDPVTVYEVFQGDEERIRDKKSETVDDFREAYRLYLTGDFATARDGFRKILDRNPDDVCAQRYVRRCTHFRDQGKPDEWDGVFALGEK